MDLFVRVPGKTFTRSYWFPSFIELHFNSHAYHHNPILILVPPTLTMIEPLSDMAH